MGITMAGSQSEQDANEEVIAPKKTLKKRILFSVMVCIGGLFLAVMILVVAVSQRIERFDLDVTQGSRADSEYNSQEDIWLIVGTDDRLHADDHLIELGPDGDNPGRRADIMFLVKPTSDSVKVMGIQRDIEVGYKERTDRLNFMLLASEQRLSDAFCRDLHVPIDHMMTIDINGFVDVVDTLGGVDITTEHAVRDIYSGLELEQGTHTLDGRQALRYVRSRHPQYQVNGQWEEVKEFDGSMQRVASSSAIMNSLADKIRTSWNPVTHARLAWALSDAVSLDEHTRLIDFLSLINKPVQIDTLHVEPTGNGLRTEITTESIDQLANAGFIGLCDVEIDDTDFPTAEEFEERRAAEQL